MKKIYILFIPTFFTLALNAQQFYSEGSNSVTQDFDIMGGAANAGLPDNWKASINTTNVKFVDDYSIAVSQTTQRAGTNMSSSAPAGIYNYGAGDAAAATDRALGGLTTAADAKSVNFYYFLKNNGFADISSFTLSYNIEKYRSGSNPVGFSMTLYYSFDGSFWQEAPAVFKSTFGPGADNLGFATVPSGGNSISGERINVSVPVGGVIYFAWNYSVSNGTNTDNAIGLALDNVNVIANYPSPLPIKLSDYKLVQSGKAVGINWTSVNEENMYQYEVQRSVNGVLFEPIGNVNVTTAGSTKYSYLDATPAAGFNYYRLKYITKEGEFNFSTILKINLGGGKTEMKILSNPVNSKKISVLLSNFDEGKYSINVFNSNGQLVIGKGVKFLGGTATEEIILPSIVPKGIYFVQLMGDSLRVNKQVMVN